jgi:hypothetical protein
VNLAKLEKDFAPFQAEAQYDETQRKIAKAAKDYIDDATRRNKLTKDQLESPRSKRTHPERASS